MKRSDRRPNRCAQDVRDLEAGRTYSLTAITTDYKDLLESKLVERRHAIRFQIDGVEIVPERTLQAILTRAFARPMKFCMNFHYIVFRARSESAKLTILDWAEEGRPGGPIGQELIANFIEVQPYLLPDPQPGREG